MLTKATNIAHYGECVEVQSDSILAIMAALGASCSSKIAGCKRLNKKKDPNHLLKIRVRHAYIRARRKLGTHRLQIKKVKGHSQQTWNEVADELAAIGRNTAPPYNAPPAATSQLHDRVRRALDAIGDHEIEHWEGIDLSI